MFENSLIDLDKSRIFSKYRYLFVPIAVVIHVGLAAVYVFAPYGHTSPA